MQLVTMADMHGGRRHGLRRVHALLRRGGLAPDPAAAWQGMQWAAGDERSANATLVDGPLTLSLLFRFNDAGLIASCRAESRGGVVGKVMVQAPWEGRFSNYQTRDGIRVPFAGVVAWMRPEGRKAYLKSTATQLGYEFWP